jgi:hypothetical protein
MTENENLHVPIDISPLYQIIPKGEDILYSSICEVKHKYKKPFDGRKTTTITTKWKSHLLISESGIAIQIPQNTRKTVLFGLKNFMTWKEIETNREKTVLKQFHKDLMKLYDTSVVRFATIKIVYDHRYESKKDFYGRRNQFGKFCEIACSNSTGKVLYFIDKKGNFLIKDVFLENETKNEIEIRRPIDNYKCIIPKKVIRGWNENKDELQDIRMKYAGRTILHWKKGN